MNELYAHNKEAYDKVMEAYDNGKQRACVVHATGTGKAYIAASVAENFDRVIIIAPNNFVLNETKKICKSGVEFRTYASVMYDNCKVNGYDLIVLDEFHRSGAEKWGEGVMRLIKSNPNAKILGTSATHIRYLDGQRNMADELFDGYIVSHISLKEAIDRKILPNPTYVTALYTIDDITEQMSERINRGKKSEEEKEKALRRLNGIASSWAKSNGVSGIMRKYLDKEMQRIIVFCSKVETKKDMRKLLGGWLASAGFKHIRFYNIDYKEKRLEKEMGDFQKPCEDGVLKVAMSVNMLNEGVHIPRVDGVIMLRSTISRIIIEQQVGRCLTADNNRTPIVLDLVNNMESVGNFGIVNFSSWDKTGENGNKEDNDKGFPFSITDEIRDIRVLLMQLDNEFKSDTEFAFDKKVEEIKAFKKEYGELPNTINGGRALFIYASKFRSGKIRRMHPECVKVLQDLGFNMTEIKDRYMDNLERCKLFLAEYGRIPTKSKNASKEERFLGEFLKRHWASKSNNTDEQRLTLCREGLASPTSEDVYRFAEKQKKLGSLPLEKEYGRKPLSAKVDEVIDHFKKYGSLPPLRSGNRIMAIAQQIVVRGTEDVVKLYEAGIFNGGLKMTERVADILRSYGIEVDNVILSPINRIRSLINKYGSLKEAEKKENLLVKRTLRAIYLSATDEECIEYFNEGLYLLNGVEVRERLRKLANEGRISMEVRDIKKPEPQRNVSDEELLEFCERVGRLPIMSRDGEGRYYCAIRNRWNVKTNDRRYMQHLIDLGLYLPCSKKFKEVCSKLNLVVPKEPRFKQTIVKR